MTTTPPRCTSPGAQRTLELFQTAFHRNPTPEELRIFTIGKHIGAADLLLSSAETPWPPVRDVRAKAVKLAAWPRADRAARELAAEA